ncbi:helix-turn-helix transcriptional regulator [Caulobacter sp. S45]|uniref:ArsR/SmtB family transcription factor n=1 Tax=Caulobacter sp. S45 TaxID=1641861 RepID=UPI00131DF39C|nr:metalloregulator ArsR/SmtB family transcription factor [Caulobacter sp. S45]
MELSQAVTALSALAHEGRLRVFRELVQAGPDGLAAGEVSRRVDIQPNTLSASLAVLSHAGLVTSRRDGRSIIYSAAYERMSQVLGFLLRDCCNGSPEICAPIAAILNAAACCGGSSSPTGV